jgi:transposase-like protein
MIRDFKGEIGDFAEKKYCPHCERYERYLRSCNKAGISKYHCIICGEEVKLFSDEDQKAFDATVKSVGKAMVRPYGKRRTAWNDFS